MFTPTEKYKSTSLYRCLTATNGFARTTANDESRYIPNFTTSGKNYDASHMDKFLSSEWGRSSTPVVEARNSTRHSLRNQHSNSVVPFKVKTRPQLSKKSAKSITGLREPDYLAGTINDFSYKEVKNNTAIITAGTQLDAGTLKGHYEKEFGLLEMKFDKTKLEYSDQPSKCAIPFDRRAQLTVVKINQEELAKWKERKNEVSFKMRVYKNTFKSGAIGFDNPMNESSLVYKEEYEKMKKAKDNSEKIEKRRFKLLKNIANSNSMIEFFNKNFDKKTALPAPKILEGNSKKVVVGEHTEAWKNSTTRLFKQPLKRYSIERAQHIRNQETKGRDWNILSFANNTVEIKTLPPVDA